jgi:hypothetical protein
MAYSRDFENVRKDGTLIRVDATSIDEETNEPGTEDPAEMFFVALARAAGGQGLVSRPVKPGVDATWTAEFPGAASQFANGDKLCVIGVAINKNGPPDIWHELHTVGSRTA